MENFLKNMLTHACRLVIMHKHVAKRSKEKHSTLTNKQQCNPENSKRRELFRRSEKRRTNKQTKQQ